MPNNQPVFLRPDKPADIPETTRYRGIAFRDVPEAIGEGGNASRDLPETSIEDETAPPDLPETSIEDETAPPDVPETSIEDETAPPDVPGTSIEDDTASPDIRRSIARSPTAFRDVAGHSTHRKGIPNQSRGDDVDPKMRTVRRGLLMGSVVRIGPERGSPANCAGGAGCRRFRCSRRSSNGLAGGWRASRGRNIRL